MNKNLNFEVQHLSERHAKYMKSFHDWYLQLPFSFLNSSEWAKYVLLNGAQAELNMFYFTVH